MKMKITELQKLVNECIEMEEWSCLNGGFGTCLEEAQEELDALNSLNLACVSCSLWPKDLITPLGLAEARLKVVECKELSDSKVVCSDELRLLIKLIKKNNNR